jgi:hypothetical protein
MLLRLLLLLLPLSALAQPNGVVFSQGTLSTSYTFHPSAGSLSGPLSLNYDWDTGDPPQGCGQASAATYNITRPSSNQFAFTFESHYGDVGQNDSCSDNPLHVRTEIGNSGNTWPLNPTSGDLWGSYYVRVRQPTGCAVYTVAPCQISSNYFVIGQFHAGNSSTIPAGASPAFDIDVNACQGQTNPTVTGGGASCSSGPYGANFQITLRQCETSLTTCASLPTPAYVYTMPTFNFGQYYAIVWHVVYSQGGCTVNPTTLAVGSPCYYPGGTSCSNITCGQLQVWVNNVEVVNYTGIIVGYPENVAYGGSCPTTFSTTAVVCPYFKFGIYREYPTNLENVIVDYDNVYFGTSQASVALPQIGIGPWH